jgi:hypothetical protein
VPAIFGVRVAPARGESRTGSNNSERESTSGRSTNYGSGYLIRVFRDIGRIFSLPFLLSHPSPIGDPLRGRVQKWKRNMVSPRAKNGFNCVSCGTHRGGRAGGVSFAKTRTPRSRGLSGALRFADTVLHEPGRYRAFAPVSRLIDPAMLLTIGVK